MARGIVIFCGGRVPVVADGAVVLADAGDDRFGSPAAGGSAGVLVAPAE